jgi:manganese transport protein
LSLLLPLPLVLLFIFTKNQNLIGEFVNKRIVTIIAVIFIAVIVAFNALLLYLSAGESI